jgi:two-component system, NtrC family, response regulator
MAKILIIDDDAAIRETIALLGRKMGHAVSGVPSREAALAAIVREPFDVALCDVRLPDGSGLDLLPALKEADSSPEVIMITGFGDPQNAEAAIKKGAWDYVEKPLSAAEVKLTIDRALQYREKKQSAPAAVALKRDDILGRAAPLRECLNRLAQAASSEANVLITGETGTGKELFARAIHANNSRARNPFVVVDCAALPETLVESTLFGHVRGAFTGADKPNDGLIKQADGGTLFLDEIGEMPIAIQKAFLRVLQEKRFRPVGGGAESFSDFRLVAATNRRLEDRAAQGVFREDLLHRLRTLVIELPPLRACGEDIPDLALHYTARFCDTYRIPMKGFAPGFIEALKAYDWPGNVRELVQALEKAVVTAGGEPTLYLVHLPDHIRIRIAQASAGRKSAPELPSPSATEASVPAGTLEEARARAIAEAERRFLDGLLMRTGRDVDEACRISGLSRSRLYALLKKYHIRIPR